MEQLSLAQLADALKKKQFSSAELTQHFIRKIHNHQDLNSFISMDEEYALHQAQEADKNSARYSSAINWHTHGVERLILYYTNADHMWV